MATLLFHIAFIAVGAVLGAAAGWLVRGNGTTKSQPLPEQPVPPSRIPEVGSNAPPEPDFSAAEAVMARLHQLTESVAADVGEHNSRVQEINDELASGEEADVVASVAKLIQANEDMQRQLHSAEERLQAQANEIESRVQEARTDALTKLANRRAFDDEMARCVKEFNDSGRPTCVMMLDVDHFKKFNDTYGHQAGDEVLRGVARTLRQNVDGKEIVCRYGGEEFSVIFPGSDIDSVQTPAERARASIANQVYEFEGLDLKVTVSGGVAQLQAGETAEQVVKRADDSLYVCKENGRNCGYWNDGTTSHPLTGVEVTKQEAGSVEEEAVSELVEPESAKGEQRDVIAGLSDRESFFSDIDRRVSDWERGGAPLSVLLLEVDRFNHILEESGEKAGEVVLRAAVQFLKASMRDMDHISQLDENSFALLLPGLGVTEACATSERIRAAIERYKAPFCGEELSFTVSLGSAEITEGEEGEQLMGRAQSSLDAAREAGGNRSLSSNQEGATQSMAVSC